MEDKHKILKQIEEREKSGNNLLKKELLYPNSERENILMTKRTFPKSISEIDSERKDEPKPIKEIKNDIPSTSENLKQRLKINLNRSSSLLNFVQDQIKSDNISFEEIYLNKIEEVNDENFSIIHEEDIPCRVKINNFSLNNNCVEDILISNNHINKDQNPNYYFNKDFKDYSFNSLLDTNKKRKINRIDIPEVNEKNITVNKEKISNIKDSQILANEEYLKDLFVENRNEIDSCNKQQIIIRNRLIANYLIDKHVHLKLFDIDREEVIDMKCNEILDFKNTNLTTRLKRFYDESCCFSLRSILFRYSMYLNTKKRIFSHFCQLIVSSKIFEFLTIFIILANSIIIFISDPNDINSINEKSDDFFLYFYTLEFLLKVFAFGLILPKDAYLRDSWNVLDIFIIIVGWVLIGIQYSSNSRVQFGQLQSLRAFRLLRPLKAIKNIEGLRNIMLTILQSFSNLGYLSILLVSYFLIYGIWGLQMWTGIVQNRCMSINLGYFYDYSNFSTMCTYDTDCVAFSSDGDNFICVTGFKIPNTGITSYNDIYSSTITAFITATTEGWTDFYTYIGSTFRGNNGINKFIQDTYFLFLIFGGGFYLFNLYLAVVFDTYSVIEEQKMTHLSKTTKRLVDVIKEKIKQEQFDNDAKEDEEEKLLANGIEKYHVFKKDLNIIPRNYSTVKDMIILQNAEGKEIYQLQNKMLTMKRLAKNDYENFIKEKKKVGGSISDFEVKKTHSLRVKEPNSLPFRMKTIQPKFFMRSMTIQEMHQKFQLYQDVFEKALRKTFLYFQFKNQFCAKLLESNTGKSYMEVERKIQDFLSKKEIELSSKNFRDPQIKMLQDIYTHKNLPVSITNSENLVINSKNNGVDEFEEYNESIRLPITNIEPLKPKFNFKLKDAFRKQTSLTNAEDENIYDTINLEGYRRKEHKLLSLPSFKESMNLVRQATTKESHGLKSVHSLKRADSFKHNASHGTYNKSLRRRGSIEKNVFKFPFLDKYYDDSLKQINEFKRKVDESKNKSKIKLFLGEKIDELYLSSYRKNLKYKYIIKDKDIDIKDNFRVDSNNEFVFNNTRKIAKPIIQEFNIDNDKKHPVYMYNSSEGNLTYSEYIPYKNNQYKDDEITIVNHHLENFSLKIVSNIPPKEKDMGFERMYKRKAIIEKGRKSTTVLERSAAKLIESVSAKNINQDSKKIHERRSNPSLNQNLMFLISNDKLLKNFSLDEFSNTIIYNYIDKMDYKTLNHEFLNSEEVISKALKIDMDDTKTKVLELDNNKQINKIFNYDIETKTRKFIEWSGEEVLEKEVNEENTNYFNKLISILQNLQIIIWPQNLLMKIYYQISYIFLIIITSSIFYYILILIVISNSIVLSLHGDIMIERQSQLESANDVFTYLFLAEFLLKIIGLGITQYLTDISNYIDMMVVISGLIDIELRSIYPSSMIVSQNIQGNVPIMKMIKIFQVLRILKILKNMNIMRNILLGIYESLVKIFYVFVLLTVFILIYMILGISVIKESESLSEHLNAFYLVFQILTIENWNSSLYELSYYRFIAIIYLVSWIVIGNWILLNLFVAVLMESFEVIKEKEIKIPPGFPEYFKKYLNKDYSQNSETNKYRLIDSSEENKKKEKKIKVDSDDEEEAADIEKDEINLIKDRLNNTDNKTKRIELENELIYRLFKRVDCEHSLYILSQRNPIRVNFMFLYSHKHFDKCINFIILLATLRLVLDTFISGKNSDYLFTILDLSFTIIFISEFIIKTISLGFVMDEGSYLRDHWNKLDFLIMIIQLIEIQTIAIKLEGGDISNSSQFIKILRLLRILRPLRFISQNKDLKIIIICIFDSVVIIFNVFIILLVTIYIFCLTAMFLFYDIYKTCMIPGKTMTQTYTYVPIKNFSEILIANNISDNNITQINNLCSNNLSGIFSIAPPITFQNIVDSYLSIYILFNTEAWPDYMNSYRVFNNYYGIFFVITILIGNVFFLNLFQGVLFGAFCESYNREKEEGVYDSKESEIWWDFLNQIEDTKPDYVLYTLPNNEFQRSIYLFITSKYFDGFIFLIIFFNLLCLAISYQDSSKYYSNVLYIFNIIFTILFFVEFLLRIIGLGIRGYLNSRWNILDLFIVITSALNIVLIYTYSSDSISFKAFQCLRILRVLSLSKLMSSIKSMKPFKQLLQVIRWSLNSLFNMFTILILIYSIFAIFGCYLFSNIQYKDNKSQFKNANEFFNFDNFYTAIWTVFRCATGENWPSLMMDYYYASKNKSSDTGYAVVVGFFFSMIFFCNYIFLSLFLMIAIQKYSDFHEKTENPVEKFNENVEYFKKAWNKYASERHNVNFFMDLEGDISKAYQRKETSIHKYILELKLLKDNNNYFSFKDVLFKSLKFQYGRFKNKSLKIRIEEKKIISEIKLTSVINNFGNSFFNPLTSRLYYVVSFSFLKAFIINYQKNLEEVKLDHNQIEEFLKLNETKKFTDNVKGITKEGFPFDI